MQANKRKPKAINTNAGQQTKTQSHQFQHPQTQTGKRPIEQTRPKPNGRTPESFECLNQPSSAAPLKCSNGLIESIEIHVQVHQTNLNCESIKQYSQINLTIAWRRLVGQGRCCCFDGDCRRTGAPPRCIRRRHAGGRRLPRAPRRTWQLRQLPACFATATTGSPSSSTTLMSSSTTTTSTRATTTPSTGYTYSDSSVKLHMPVRSRNT